MDHHHRDKLRQKMTSKNAILDKLFDKGGSNRKLLWGLLHIKIVQCENLRNADKFGVKSLIMKRKRDLSDPYVVAFIDDYRLLKTKHFDDELNPEFDEEFYCHVAHMTESVKFQVMDKDTIKDDNLGKYYLPVSELIKTVDENDIQSDPNIAPGDLKRVGLHKHVYLDGKKSHGSLEFFIEFIPTRMLSKSAALPGIYFNATAGNDVKLYVNADDDGSSPVVKYGGESNNEKVWNPPRLWRDIYDAFCNAKHFIYVAGWSVDTDQYLLRGDELKEALANDKYSPNIGELLKAKAEEGVVVNLMQWDDNTSNFMFPGIMGTHDEKTRTFFKNTQVNSRFMSTVGGETNTVFQGQTKRVAFTHHQKFIIMDSPRPDGEGRELFAFVGGIDLTSGRWDNCKHPLFRSLQNEHKGDTHSACFKVNIANGPREPWHDIHSAVRGPEAIHLAQAFEERWTKQGDAGELINRNRLGLDNEMTLDNGGGWCAQLSRSIDSRVDCFDPSINRERDSIMRFEDKANWRAFEEENTKSPSKRYETAEISDIIFSRCLDRKKGRLVDNSIHLSNIHHIRRAKHFIYIETQYFMGSSFMWSEGRSVKCGNMIAAEIAFKICEKIAANEPFAVYILLPMWMEGITETGPIQEMLYYQRVTIEAMYKQVEEALMTKMANSSDYGLKVTDYLNFYCLGTRETSSGSQATGTPTTDDEILLSKTRRHQIYVHSKFMIVDDDVALIGTANINQRSMDGCRDSEIMMASWQPEHLATEKSIAKGDVHGFRLHSWATITGEMNEVFRNPSSRECVNTMNEIANRNWQKYLAKEATDMKSNLLPFPLEYDGGIKPREGLSKGYFPDTKGSVLGKQSFLLPDIFLT